MDAFELRAKFKDCGPRVRILGIRFQLHALSAARKSVAHQQMFAGRIDPRAAHRLCVPSAADLDAAFDAGLLVPWTRWVTPAASPKRFDARFFLAAVPSHQLASHDEHETTESVWMRALDAIEQVEHGKMLVAPATYKCLAVLATYRNLAEAFEAARKDPPRTWCPVVRMEEGKRLILLSDDPEHPDCFGRMPGPTRMLFDGGRFVAAGE